VTDLPGGGRFAVTDVVADPDMTRKLVATCGSGRAASRERSRDGEPQQAKAQFEAVYAVRRRSVPAARRRAATVPPATTARSATSGPDGSLEAAALVSPS
jgi:hypothetical protein